METHNDQAATDPVTRGRPSVRVLPGAYMMALFVASFLSGLMAYLGYESTGVGVVALISWLIIPALWFGDKIVFDGRRLRRTGIFPRGWARLTGTRDRLKISDIEQIETAVFPGIKRGRNIYITYRTAVTGKSARFVFSSGHRGYLNVVRSLLAMVPEDTLDNTSIDLRDYLIGRAEARHKAVQSDIPSSDVLDSSVRSITLSGRVPNMPAEAAAEKANSLRRLANELRVSGRLLQSFEAFRRAVLLHPADARLLFDFAVCVRSIAGVESDQKLEHRAMAMMRLAERHAGNDHVLLSRIGESYFQIGEWRRASIVFRRIAESLGHNFRMLRGMAELALREGKMAHVIHNYAAAQRVASTTSLKRWSQTEVDYFSHLNQDEEYLELEISRVNLLETLERTKRSAMRIMVIGLVVILLGLAFTEDLVANVGWAVSGLSLILWLVTVVMGKMLTPRIPFELMETDE